LDVPRWWAHTLDGDLRDINAAAIVTPLLLVELEDLQVLGEKLFVGHVDIALGRVQLCPLVAYKCKLVCHEVLIDVLNRSVRGCVSELVA
jgi:hypothetical protein